jgi:hypothetical protein
LSSLSSSPNLTGMAQRMSTTGKKWSEGFADLGLLSVGDVDDKLKHIGHSLSDFSGVECWGRRRQAEAYRTFIAQLNS